MARIAGGRAIIPIGFLPFRLIASGPQSLTTDKRKPPEGESFLGRSCQQGGGSTDGSYIGAPEREAIKMGDTSNFYEGSEGGHGRAGGEYAGNHQAFMAGIIVGVVVTFVAYLIARWI